MNENTMQTTGTFSAQGLSIAQQENMNVGAVSIEQKRAVAEVEGKLYLAKKFPRSNAKSIERLLDSCKSKEFAESAFYSVPNRGTNQPSIRFAEECVYCCGNIEFGHRELSRSEKKSEIEVFAFDMENNNYSTRQITVMHIRDTKNGSYPIKDQNDIDGRIANVASKQMRGRILAILPKNLVNAGIAECKRTLAGDNGKSVSDRIQKMLLSFKALGVSSDQIAVRLGYPVDSMDADDIVDLIGVYNALKEGYQKASDFFGSPKGSDTADHGNTQSAIARMAERKAAEQANTTTTQEVPPKAMQELRKPSAKPVAAEPPAPVPPPVVPVNKPHQTNVPAQSIHDEPPSARKESDSQGSATPTDDDWNFLD